MINSPVHYIIRSTSIIGAVELLGSELVETLKRELENDNETACGIQICNCFKVHNSGSVLCHLYDEPADGCLEETEVLWNMQE